MIKSAILEEQKAQLKKEELAARILNQSRNELYLKLRYLDLALGNLALAPGTVSPAGTDGGAARAGGLHQALSAWNSSLPVLSSF